MNRRQFLKLMSERLILLPHPGSPEIFSDASRTALSYVDMARQVSGSISRPVDFDYIWGDALGELRLMAPAGV